MMSNTDSLTAEELRRRLYHSLREKGLVDALKSQLRNKLVCELRAVGVRETFQSEAQHSTERSLLHKASNSLVVDHLRQCHYDYSLSVFLPECAIPETQLFTARDMLQLLNISSQSTLYKNLMRHIDGENQKGFLWQLLCEVAASCGSLCHDNGTQTDHTRLPAGSSLEEQFSKVDDYYTSLEDNDRFGCVPMEQRLLAYQQQLEDRSHTDTTLQIARFKENELARMRLEERETMRQEVDRLRREIEASYQSKCTSLSERERHSVERLQKEQQIAEKETFNQRQSLLEEIEAVRLRETNIRRAVEVNQREKSLWEEKMKTKDQLIKKREEDVRKADIEYNQKLHDATQKFKLEEQARLLERSKDLDYREIRVRENERRLDDELRNIDGVKTDLREKHKMCNNLEGELTKMKHELIGARAESELLSGRVREMVDYQVVKEDNAIMRRERDNLKTRIAEVTRDVLLERQKNEELLREMTERASKPTPEVYLMQKQLDKVRSEMKQERAVFEHQKQNMNQHCQDEVERSRELLRKYEEQTYQLEEMNREIRDLHHQLGHTKTALTNEVYRKPKASLLSRSRSPCDLDEVDPSLIQIADQPQLLFSASHGLIDNILDSHQATAPVAGSRSDDYSYSMDLVEDTKHRLRNLEKEAENLDHHYQNFQYRMTSAGGVLDGQAPTASVAPSSDAHYTQSKDVTSRTGRVAFREAIDTRSVMSSPRNKHLETSTVDSQPLSSTPTRPPTQDVDSAPTHPTNQSFQKLYGESSLVDNSMSTVQSSPVLHSTSRSGLSARPLSVDDLECRPGSPDVVVLHSSGADSQHIPNSGLVTPALSQATTVQPPMIASLDDAWKTQADTNKVERRREDERRQQEEEDRAYEEEQTKRAEERMKREQMAWETEQRQLAQLQGKPMTAVSVESAAGTSNHPESVTPEPAVDPVMLKYMQMVEQNKLKEKEVAKNTVTIWNKGKQQ